MVGYHVLELGLLSLLAMFIPASRGDPDCGRPNPINASTFRKKAPPEISLPDKGLSKPINGLKGKAAETFTRQTRFSRALDRGGGIWNRFGL